MTKTEANDSGHLSIKALISEKFCSGDILKHPSNLKTEENKELRIKATISLGCAKHSTSVGYHGGNLPYTMTCCGQPIDNSVLCRSLVAFHPPWKDGYLGWPRRGPSQEPGMGTHMLNCASSTELAWAYRGTPTAILRLNSCGYIKAITS